MRLMACLCPAMSSGLAATDRRDTLGGANAGGGRIATLRLADDKAMVANNRRGLQTMMDTIDWMDWTQHQENTE